MEWHWRGLVMARPDNCKRFRRRTNGKAARSFRSVPVQNGALWIGTEGAGLYRFQNGAWTNYNSAQGIRNQYIWSLAEDGAWTFIGGNLGRGAFCAKGRCFDFAPGMENYAAHAGTFVHTDDLWIGTTAGLLRYQNGSASRVNQDKGQTLTDVRAIGPGPTRVPFGMARRETV